jgi:hypothetical protein
MADGKTDLCANTVETLITSATTTNSERYSAKRVMNSQVRIINMIFFNTFSNPPKLPLGFDDVLPSAMASLTINHKSPQTPCIHFLQILGPRS